MLISIETHITCDFPGGSEPLPPSGSALACSFRYEGVIHENRRMLDRI